jgi:hypothetical protein
MNVTAVIPIRYADCFTDEGAPRMQLAGHALWEITLRQACESRSLGRVVVAYDDERFLDHLEAWRSRIMTCARPPDLSSDNATTLDVLAFAADWLAEQKLNVDYLMLLEITHPLRPKGIIDDLVESAGVQNADSLITCYPVHYNFWRRDGSGSMGRISGTGENAEVSLYEELTGICSLFRPRCLATDNPFGEQVDIVPIDRFWATVDVRDEDGCWLAEQYLKRLNITL